MTMAFVVAPSRNKTLQLAWAMHKSAQKAEAKGKKPEEKKPAPAKASKKKGPRK